MADLIERDALLSKIEPDEYYHSNEIRDMLRDCPTVTPESLVRHGRWKYYHEWKCGKKRRIAVCTNCRFERELYVNFGSVSYCPNCGAKMDLEE